MMDRQPDSNVRYPSIFNDVIGPVMRGPSSSHCAASVRIGRLARDLMDGQIERVLVEYDAGGSLATTHQSQGSDMGLFGGLLGWDATDERLPGSAAAIARAGIEVCIRISEYGAAHPNTYKLTLANGDEQHQMIALSTGGGMIEVIEIDGFKVSLGGDYCETLLYLDAGADEVSSRNVGAYPCPVPGWYGRPLGHGLWPQDLPLRQGIEKIADEIVHELSGQIDADEVRFLDGASASLIEIKGQRFPNPDVLARLRAQYGTRRVKLLSPVLPVLSRRDLRVPFITCQEMLAYNAERDLDLWELALHYESARGGLSHEQVLKEMRDLVRVMEESIRQGIQGTEYADRILGAQSPPFRMAMESGRLLDGGALDRIILYVTALMEVKSSMGVIVAAPTAGACGALPGACIGAGHAMGSSLEEMTRAMLAAGVIGVFIAAHATFAAEVGGCQAECGAASGMAAAALVTLARGTTRQATDAASMALQNVLGMVCDPVANRVEVPCLGKNVMAGSNALACANMALAGFDAVIPLDEVIEAMDRVGKSLPPELRCTALGGLSTTHSSKEIERKLSRSRAGDATASPAR